MKFSKFFAILLLVGLFVNIVYLIVIPDSFFVNKYDEYVIKGIIEYADDLNISRPNFVYAFYNPINLNVLYQSDMIELTRINWFGDAQGTFELLITVPAGLNNIVLTYDSQSCNHKLINLDGDLSNVDLSVGVNNCNESTLVVSDDSIQVKIDTRNKIDYVQEILIKSNFTEKDNSEIKLDLIKANEAIVQSNYFETDGDINNSLLWAYFAQWYSIRARYKINLLNLEYCIELINQTIESKDKSCYLPTILSYGGFKTINGSFMNYNETDILTKNYLLDRNIINSNDIKNLIYHMYTNTNSLGELSSKCGRELNIINETFNFQEPFCNKKNTTLVISNLIWVIVGLFIGMTIQRGIEKKGGK